MVFSGNRKNRKMKITNEDKFIDILQRFTTDEKYNELNVIDAVDTYAKEQVIKELEDWIQFEKSIKRSVLIMMKERIKELKQKVNKLT